MVIAIFFASAGETSCALISPASPVVILSCLSNFCFGSLLGNQRLPRMDLVLDIKFTFEVPLSTNARYDMSAAAQTT